MLICIGSLVCQVKSGYTRLVSQLVNHRRSTSKHGYAYLLLVNGGSPPTRTSKLVFELVDRLVGLVVKASASRAEDPGFESRLRRDFSWVESNRVSVGTGWPDVSIL